MLSLAPSPFRRLFLLASLPLLGFDLLTKYLATAHLPERWPTFIGPFEFYLVYHPWNLNAVGAPYQYPFFSSIILPGLAFLNVLACALFYNHLFIKHPYPGFSKLLGFSFGLSAAGCLGNLSSYAIWSQGVPDFLTVPTSSFIFNFADIWLCLGALLALICVFKPGPLPAPSPGPSLN